MKKILSLLLATVACSTVFAVTAFASTNLSMTVSPEEIKAGETVKVKLEVGEISATSFAAGIAFDKDKFVATSVVSADGDDYFYLMDANGKPGRNYVQPIAEPDLVASKTTGRIGATWNGKEITYLPGVIFEVTFVASEDIAAGDVYFNAFESLDSTSNDNDRALDGKEGRDFAIVKSVKVVGDEPPAPTADVTVSAKTDADAAWEASTGKNAVYWGVDFVEGKFPGTALATITDGEVSKDLKIGVAVKATDFDVNGAVSFAVYAIADEATAATLSMTLAADGCEVKYN